ELPEAVLEQSSADVAGRTASRIDAEVRLFSAKQTLGLVMGVPYESVRELPDGISRFPKASEIAVRGDLYTARAIEYLFENRRDYLAAKLRLKSAQALLAAAENNTLPQVDLKLETGYRSIDEGSRFSRYWSALSDNTTGA